MPLSLEFVSETELARERFANRRTKTRTIQSCRLPERAAGRREAQAKPVADVQVLGVEQVIEFGVRFELESLAEAKDPRGSQIYVQVTSAPRPPYLPVRIHDKPLAHAVGF